MFVNVGPCDVFPPEPTSTRKEAVDGVGDREGSGAAAAALEGVVALRCDLRRFFGRHTSVAMLNSG